MRGDGGVLLLAAALAALCRPCDGAAALNVLFGSGTGTSRATAPVLAACGGAAAPWDAFGRAPSPPAYINATAAASPRAAAATRPTAALQTKPTLLRRSYCGGKGEGARRKASASGSKLAACLAAAPAACDEADAAVIRAAARALPSVRKLLGAPPQCFVATSRGSCASVRGNPETAASGAVPRVGRAARDWRAKQWNSCALVGRSPVAKMRQDGKAIDGHSAVWRFNLAVTDGGLAPYIGKRTTLRLVNAADSGRASHGLGGKSEPRRLRAGASETWLFWQYNAIGNMERVHRELRVPVRLASPRYIKWMMDTYFAMKRDLESLGLGPFMCPTSVSSGMHAAIGAVPACKQVHLFGYSYYDAMLVTRPGHSSGAQNMYPGHSWQLDFTILRLMHLAGVASICSSDDPSVPFATLRKRGLGK